MALISKKKKKKKQTSTNTVSSHHINKRPVSVFDYQHVREGLESDDR